MQPKTCCLCSQILGIQQNDLISAMASDTEYLRRVVLESHLFVVIPSIGPLVRGHSLLCPKRHFRSLAQLPACYDDEYVVMKARLVSVLSELYATPIHCFEHGAAAAGTRVLCTVEHAHLHLVPANASIAASLRSENTWLPIGSTLQDLRSAVGEGEYIYYEDPEGIRLVRLAGNESIPSQYMRRVIGDALGRGHLWDWRANPRIDETIRTFEDVAAYTL